jgi:hypothetical protein
MKKSLLFGCFLALLAGVAAAQITRIDLSAQSKNTAATATALAANGTNCSAGQYAQGVDASGNAEGCATPAGTYSLPTATSSVLGGVKPDGTSILNTAGAISATASSVGLGNVTNDAQTKAAIVPNTAPSAAQLLIGNAGGTAYAPVSLSGPVSVTSAGVTSVGTLNQNTTGTAGGLSANIAESQVANLTTDLAAKAPLVSPSFTTPALGTPASGVITNLTGTCASCSVGGNAATATSATSATSATTAANLSGTPALPNGTTGTTQTTGDVTTKLATDAFVGASITANAYSLPTASTSTLGGVTVDGSTITISSGVISSAGGYTLPTQYKIWSCQPGLGDGLNAITAGTYLQSTCWNKTGVTVTLTGVQCYTDNAGSSTLNAAGNTLGALLTGAVTCSSTIASGTQSANVALPSGDYIKFTFVADGTSKQATWVITGTL